MKRERTPYSFFTIVKIPVLFCALYAVFILTGCASTEDTGRLQWDVNELRAEINKMKKTSQSSARMETVNSTLSEIEQGQKATAQTVSDLMIQVQSLTSEFQVLTGRFEEARYFSEKSSSELLESRDMLTGKLKELELAVADLEKKIEQAKAAPPPVQKAEPPKVQEMPQQQEVKAVPKESAPPEAPKDVKSEVKDIYMSAYQAFKEGKAGEAREKFLSILNDFPVNDYTDNARFWIGETYYIEEKYEDAILSYQELFDKNPKSDKVPGAMLKQGLAFYALKDQKTGKIILERLIEKYPDTEPAKLALRKIKKPSVPPKK